MAERRGIDISSHQGQIDFAAVKAAGYDFVIIKAGQHLTQMRTFRERYLPAVRAAGLDWGAYWWSDAVTVEEAQAEAQAFVKALNGLKPTFPVWMDQEYASPAGTAWGVNKGRQLRTDMARAFLEVLEQEGYYAGLYASKDWMENWVYDSQLRDYDRWVAQYAAKCSYSGSYGIWQQSGSGEVPGIQVPVDLNICYQDYPSIIKKAGLNGWGGQPADISQEKADYKALYESEKGARKTAEASYENLLHDLKTLVKKWGDG